MVFTTSMGVASLRPRTFFRRASRSLRVKWGAWDRIRSARPAVRRKQTLLIHLIPLSLSPSPFLLLRLIPLFLSGLAQATRTSREAG